MTILVTGATGKIGRHLVTDLLDRGSAVRALSRTPGTAALPGGVEVLEGDLATAPAEAFDRIDAVFVFPAAQGADVFVERAVAAGVTRFVVLSSLAVSKRHARDAGSVSETHHRTVEQAVISRTKRWTVLRPGNFASNLLSWAFPIRSGYPVRVPCPTSSQVLIHECDIAAAAAITLTQPGHEGQVYELTGPQSLTQAEQLTTISAAIGRDIPLAQVSPEQFRADVVAYLSDDIIDMLLTYWSDTVTEPETPTRAPLGLTMTPLADWARDHRSAFRG